MDSHFSTKEISVLPATSTSRSKAKFYEYFKALNSPLKCTNETDNINEINIHPWFIDNRREGLGYNTNEGIRRRRGN